MDVNLNDAFIDAVKARNLDQVRFYVEAGVNVNYKGFNGNTGILEACGMYDYAPMLDLLLELNADVNIINDQNDTPLTWAAYRGHAASVQWLVQNGANTAHLGHEGVTARALAEEKGFDAIVAMLGGPEEGNEPARWNLKLFRGAADKKLDVVEAMIELKADVNSRHQNGNTAFIMATCNDDIKTMETLFAAGADINIRNSQNDSAICWAAFEGHINASRWLLDHDADIDTKSYENKTPLVLSQEYNHPEIEAMLAAKIANRPADYVSPAVPENPDQKMTGQSLVNFVKQRNMDMVKSALESKVDANYQGMNGNTAMIEACGSYDDPAMLDLLLKHNADVNLRNLQRDMPLTWAAYENHPLSCQWLVDHGADVKLRGYEGMTGQQLADRKGHVEIANMLKKHDPMWRNEALFLAATQRHYNNVASMLDDGANVNYQGDNGNTALIMAACNDDVKMMQQLFDAGADVNIRNSQNDNAICWTAFEGKLHATDWLLQHNADIETKSYEGKTPLMLAEERGHVAIADILQVYITQQANANNVLNEAPAEPPLIVNPAPEALENELLNAVNALPSTSSELAMLTVSLDAKDETTKLAAAITLVREQKEEIKRLQALTTPTKPELKRNPSQELNDDKKCIVCLERDRTQVFVPCGHFALCKPCVDLLQDKQCPMCRKVFAQAITVFTP